jgi:hypothetical protein
MRKLCAALAVMLVLVLVAPAFAAEITGTLVDEACYTKDKAAVAHPECDADGAKKGQSVAIVTAAGEMYLVAGNMTKNNNARLVPHMSKKVTAVGSLGLQGTKKQIFASALKEVS